MPSAKVVKDIPKGVLATDKSITTQAPFCVDLMEKHTKLGARGPIKAGHAVRHLVLENHCAVAPSLDF